jgi:hypothetical protein
MKSSRLTIKWSLALIPLLVAGIYGQQARSANLDKERIASLSDIGQTRFSLSSEGICQQLNFRPPQGVNIDLTEADIPLDNQNAFTRANSQSKFQEGSKVFILGGRSAFPI